MFKPLRPAGERPRRAGPRDRRRGALQRWPCRVRRGARCRPNAPRPELQPITGGGEELSGRRCVQAAPHPPAKRPRRMGLHERVRTHPPTAPKPLALAQVHLARARGHLQLRRVVLLCRSQAVSYPTPLLPQLPRLPQLSQLPRAHRRPAGASDECCGATRAFIGVGARGRAFARAS